MEAPIEFWNALTTAIGSITMIVVIYWAMKMASNMIQAFQKPHYVTNHYHYKLTNCTLVEPEDIR